MDHVFHPSSLLHFRARLLLQSWWLKWCPIGCPPSPPSAWNMVGQQYTPQQRTFMAIEYYKKVGTRDFMEEIITDFIAQFPGAIPPSRKTILRQARHLDSFATLHNRNSKVIFHEIWFFFISYQLIWFSSAIWISTTQASPGATHSGRPKTATTLANAAAVRAVCARDADKELDQPHSPVSLCWRNVLGLDKFTWYCLVRQEKLHPYKIIKSHKLQPEDYPHRLQMCHYLATLTPAALSNFLFSDEAQFNLDGTVNSQNARQYSPRKGSLPAGQRQGRPGHFWQEKTNFPQKVMVFLGVRGNGTMFGSEVLADSDYLSLSRYLSEHEQV